VDTYSEEQKDQKLDGLDRMLTKLMLLFAQIWQQLLAAFLVKTPSLQAARLGKPSYSARTIDTIKCFETRMNTGFEELFITDYRLEPEVLDEVVRNSSLDRQRSERERRVGRALHFRQGKPGSWRDVLCPYHIDMIALLILQHAPELNDLCRDKEIGDVIASY
jgi:hypothetical protein